MKHVDFSPMHSYRPTANEIEYQKHGNTVLSQHPFQHDDPHVI